MPYPSQYSNHNRQLPCFSKQLPFVTAVISHALKSFKTFNCILIVHFDFSKICTLLNIITIFCWYTQSLKLNTFRSAKPTHRTTNKTVELVRLRVRSIMTRYAQSIYTILWNGSINRGFKKSRTQTRITLIIGIMWTPRGSRGQHIYEIAGSISGTFTIFNVA